MKTEVVGFNLCFILKNDRELYSLVPENMRPPMTIGTKGLPVDKQSLTSRLCTASGVELATKTTLKFVPETLNGGGIDIEFKPAGEHDWYKIKAINISAAYRLFDQLASNRHVVARYAGDFRIDIKFDW